MYCNQSEISPPNLIVALRNKLLILLTPEYCKLSPFKESLTPVKKKCEFVFFPLIQVAFYYLNVQLAFYEDPPG